MHILPPNAALILPTLKEAIREQERLHAFMLQIHGLQHKSKMIKETEAIIKAHKDMAEFITQPDLVTEISLNNLPHLNHGDEDYEIDN